MKSAKLFKWPKLFATFFSFFSHRNSTPPSIPLSLRTQYIRAPTAESSPGKKRREEGTPISHIRVTYCIRKRGVVVGKKREEEEGNACSTAKQTLAHHIGIEWGERGDERSLLSLVYLRKGPSVNLPSLKDTFSQCLHARSFQTICCHKFGSDKAKREGNSPPPSVNHSLPISKKVKG